MSTRTYYDPLHQSITLNTLIPEEKMVMELIDSSPFQRLRRIKQLGPAYLTFHGAESSRFTHSLGVFHLARRAINHLSTFDSKLNEHKFLLYGAALLHDLGHGPLSHTSEEIFKISHEDWTAKLIQSNEEINFILNKYGKGHSKAISDLIQSREAPKKLIISLISSQLDCDRLDYLIRDSYTTGARYGQLDIDRIISAMTIAPDGDLAIHPKGLMAVEHYLVIRNLMYRSVYNHRLNEVCNWLLEQIVKTARKLGPKEIWADVSMSEWLWNYERMSPERFLSNDDIITGYHINRWQESSNNNLSTLCRRFIQRDLLKALNVSSFSLEIRLEALAKARILSEKYSIEPDISCGLREQIIKSYHPYKYGLRLWDGNKLEALEKASQLVERLIEANQSSWLIYPKEIEHDLKIEIKNLAIKN
ncbi:HD domain-containing protein [Prochlorococcus marinus]|uniref:HD family phosphohydrolase n=1 Tax=Prochlorococcus marinus XMU1408 TaxID=2213228 RepID=A0A318R0K6_PROMR|nr:HD domain-containing protein [Prochlorococcus marinus]MBW3041391.1 HD family phosphohydrolase [Prochlorococcus marinus str. XMU1408]PYE02555.1 HD family phosphohydrolase [Prochlorococcus marinus XMU1408]